MTTINKGEIVGLEGSWGSGIAQLYLKDENGDVIAVPAENPSFIRALEAAYGDIIEPGHTATIEAVKGQSIYWVYDDLGLILGGFVPEEEASLELEETYLNQ